MTNHAVVIAGGGPTGLMLAAELALGGADVAIVERRVTQELAGTRAGGLHARTIELLDQRGVAERFLAAGKTMQVTSYATHMIDISDFPTRHPYGLALGQNHIEQILAAWAGELGVTWYRGCEVVGFEQDEHGVDVGLSDGRTLRAGWLVGCDGGRSLVRKQAGIEFPGWDPSVSYLIAEFKMTGAPPFGMRHGARGVNGLGPMEGGKLRAVLIEDEVRHGDEPTLDELRAALVAVYGSDFGVHDVTWLSRFSDMTRQAATYRAGRVLVAGDAAHIHSPAGGQGLNLGIHDAVNLGWKLAQVAAGVSPVTLLDTYQSERHPIVARALQTTMATTAIGRGDDRTTALRTAIGEMLRLDEPRRHYGGLMSGLELRYDLGAGHPLLGRRMPDLDLATATGPRRVYSYLHTARPLLLDLSAASAMSAAALGTSAVALGAPGSGPSAATATIDVAAWPRVQHVVAEYAGPWILPVLGDVPAPAAVLVRPDGYVAWVGTGTADGLVAALAAWFGTT